MMIFKVVTKSDQIWGYFVFNHHLKSKNIPVGRRSAAGESRPSRWNVQKTEGLEAWLKSRSQIYLNRRFSIKILMLRSNTAHLQSEDKSAEPSQEQRARRRVNEKRKTSSSSFRTQSRGRTGTGVNLLVFETSASTDSAIWASAEALSSGSAVQR